MESVMHRVRRLTAEALGCDDCTMLVEWRTASVQKPHKCKLNELFINCPVTGEMPYDWEKCDKELRYMFFDNEGES